MQKLESLDRIMSDDPNMAVIWLHHAGDEPQERGLAGAIATDQAHAFAGLDREIGLDQEGVVAEFQRHLVKAYEGHGVVCYFDRKEGATWDR